MSKNKIDITIERKIRNKDFESAFNLIVKTYKRRIYWHIKSYVRSHQNTDDVLQNTFIKIWKGLPNYKGNASLYTWLYRIATNESLTFLKKENKTVELPINTENYTTQSLNNLNHNEITKRLNKAIEQLPLKQKEVFNLKYFEDLKYEEIANLTGTSVGALKANYHLAVKKIEKFLTQD